MSVCKAISMWMLGAIVVLLLGVAAGSILSTQAPAQEGAACQTVAMFKAAPEIVALGDKLSVNEVPANLVPRIKAQFEEVFGPAPFEYDELIFAKNSDMEGVIVTGFINKTCIVHAVMLPEDFVRELIVKAVGTPKEGI